MNYSAEYTVNGRDMLIEADITPHLEGRYRPATYTDPAEFPDLELAIKDIKINGYTPTPYVAGIIEDVLRADESVIEWARERVNEGPEPEYDPCEKLDRETVRQFANGVLQGYATALAMIAKAGKR